MNSTKQFTVRVLLIVLSLLAIIPIIKRMYENPLTLSSVKEMTLGVFLWAVFGIILVSIIKYVSPSKKKEDEQNKE